MRTHLRYWLFLIVLVAVVLVIDQTTKRIIINNLHVGESFVPISALSEVFQITRSQNTGAAFGVVPQASDIFLIIAIVVSTLMLIFYARLKEPAWLLRLGIALVCAGALGNALDRLQYGAVVDFIHYRIPGVISNVSNLADHAIVFGVLLIFIQSWRSDRPKKGSTLEREEAS
jgi:signal peptidase II